MNDRCAGGTFEDILQIGVVIFVEASDDGWFFATLERLADKAKFAAATRLQSQATGPELAFGAETMRRLE